MACGFYVGSRLHLILLLVAGALLHPHANEMQCRRDCFLPVNPDPEDGGQVWYGKPDPRYKETLEFHGGVGAFRPVGPTRPPHSRGHPW